VNVSIPRYVRAGAGLIVVVVLAAMLGNWWGDYRTAAEQARRAKASADASGTTNATATASTVPTPSKSSAGKGSRVFTPATITSGTKVVIVLIDGLNLRKTPEPDGASIRGLKKGETLIVVSEKTKGWYRARDEHGVLGWVSSNEAYTAVKKR